MSFSFNTQCYNCKLGSYQGDGSCKDQQIIQDGINKLYEPENSQNHKGAGEILMSCSKLEKVN